MLKGIHGRASPRSRRPSSTNWRAEPRLEASAAIPVTLYATRVSYRFRFPQHWVNRSRRPASGTTIVSGNASTFTSALCPHASHVAITARSPFARMLARVMGSPCLLCATIPNGSHRASNRIGHYFSTSRGFTLPAARPAAVAVRGPAGRGHRPTCPSLTGLRSPEAVVGKADVRSRGLISGPYFAANRARR
jgi:hypothetical protein